MARLLILGLGYTASRLAAALGGQGWRVAGTTRDGRDGSIAFDDGERVAFEIAGATHILSSVPPGAGDPVLAAHGAAIAASGAWLGYLSSTGVYGDTGGAWVDESGPIGAGRRTARSVADAEWLAMGARVFRLPAIYGPEGRSALQRVLDGRAHWVDMPGQVFSRVHVDDIVAGVVAAFDGPPGAYNLADDRPASQEAVIAHACDLLGVPRPSAQAIEALGEASRGFYAENRRVANGKAKRVLGWRPRYPDYRFGLRALSATMRPPSASTAPAAASSDQR